VLNRDLAGMAVVARAVDVPISSDESNRDLDSVLRIIDQRAAAILNLKVSKNGGLYRCKRIASIAAAAGIPIIVGGNTTFEIGRQASRHSRRRWTRTWDPRAALRHLNRRWTTSRRGIWDTTT
jgi:L-alanine-DL-glutamate epimerase-like enolase superfamily enzyme